ncbi:hypothetical protein MMC26_002948 [Xylographa opegraphella]|nr:hypothetical protein [Xylographa opegraphella]
MASAQNHWVEPPDNIGLSNGVVTGDTTIPVWAWGTTHLLEWTTPWEFFNLFLVQDYKPNNEDTILTNVTNITSFNWTVATDIIDLSLSPICWFKLHTTTSEGDSFFESAAFNLSGGPSWPASELVLTTVLPTSSSAPTSTPTLTSSPTPVSLSILYTSTTSTPTPTTLPSSDPNTTTTPTSSHLITSIALGVSIPVLLILGLLIAWTIRRRRRKPLPPQTANSSAVEIAAEGGSSDAKEMEATQVHELFSPVSLSELHDDAKWEMAA